MVGIQAAPPNVRATSDLRGKRPSRAARDDLVQAGARRLTSAAGQTPSGEEGQAAAPALDDHCWPGDRQVQGLPVRRSASDARAPFDFERSARGADASTLAIPSFASRFPPCARPRARRGPQRARLPARRRPRFSTERENRISDLLVGRRPNAQPAARRSPTKAGAGRGNTARPDVFVFFDQFVSPISGEANAVPNWRSGTRSRCERVRRCALLAFVTTMPTPALVMDRLNLSVALPTMI